MKEEHTKFLEEFIDNNPVVTLDQMVDALSDKFEGFSISKSGVDKHLKESCSYTLKRITKIPVKRNSPDVIELRFRAVEAWIRDSNISFMQSCILIPQNLAQPLAVLPGYTKGNCPRLSQQRIKACYSCGDPSHLIRECPKRNTATVGEKHTRYDDHLPTVPASSSSLTLGSSSTQSSSSPTPILFAVSKSVHRSDIESSKMTASVQKNIVRTRSKASTTITTAVIPEDDDDADDPDYAPSDDQSESDKSEHDSDIMSIDSQERQDIEDDARLLQSSSTPGATPQSDGEAAHSSSTPLQETHADTFAFHSQFELCLQTYSATWARHCGLISFNRQLAIEPRWSYVDGRLLVAQVTDASGAYDPLLIYVLYAPAHHTDRPAFFHSLNSMLRFDDAPPQRTVLLGDFNHNIHLPMTHHDSNQHCLPTFGTISTIDFILVTSDMQHLTTYPRLTYVKGCDHSALTICLTVGSVKVDPGIWRCNPFLMSNRKFRSELTAFCSSSERHLPAGNAPQRWDHFKVILKSFLLRRTIDPSTSAAIAALEAELDKQYQDSASILVLRSGHKWRKLGERSNAYFYKCLKDRQQQQAISELVADDGTILSMPEELTNCAKGFYSKLYSTKQVSPQATDFLLFQLPDTVRLNDSQQTLLLTEWTDDEVEVCLAHTPTHSSPGIDGLPYMETFSGNFAAEERRSSTSEELASNFTHLC
ncbi:hypothetical protein G6F37_011766 [Rhizopus arrhizus]|nr:hypothetical protein G6F37_011766 [Rhizopus arrhizus]